MGYGGIELMVDTLAREQVAKGHEVLVLGVKPKNVETPYGLEAVFAKPVRRPGSWHKLYYSFMLLKTAGFGDFDVVHIHVQWLIPAASIIKRLSKKPAVLTLHADPSKAIAKFRIPMVAISQNQKSRLERLGIKPVAVIYNGIDTKKYPFRTIKDDFFIYLGRIDEMKGTHIAVKAAKMLNEKLVIIGPVMNRRYFDAFIKPFIDGRDVVYLGEVGFATKVEYLSRAKALLYPVQYDEFFGIVIVEALATGTPVIGFQRGSVAEIVRDGVTGYLVRDFKGMCKAMKLVDKAGYKRM